MALYDDAGNELKRVYTSDYTNLEDGQTYEVALLGQVGPVAEQELENEIMIDAFQEIEPATFYYTGGQSTFKGSVSAQDLMVVETAEPLSLNRVDNIEIVDMSTPYQSTLIDVNAETVSQNATEIVLDDGEILTALVVEGNHDDVVDIDDAVLDSQHAVQYQGREYNAYDFGEVSVLIANDVNVI